MAYFDLKTSEREEIKTKKAKIWGIAIIVLCSFIFLALLTSFTPHIKSFLLGFFGLFIYPLSIICFCVGIALLNNKKYVMPIKYLIFLLICVLAVLCLINIIILGNPDNTFFEYLALTYNFKYTAGGILAGIFVAPFIKTIGIAGTVIIFLVVLTIFVALIVDFLNSIKVYGFKNAISKKSSDIQAIKIEKEERKKKVITEPKIEQPAQVEDFNLFQEKEITNKDAFIKLGLIEGNLEASKAPKEEKSIREQLLTKPTTVDLDYFSYKNKPSKTEIEVKNNLQQLKEEKIQETPPVKEPANNNFKVYDFFSKNTFDKTAEELQVNETTYETPYEPEIREKKFVDLSENEERVDEAISHVDNYIAPPLSLLDKHEVDLTTLNEDIVGKRVQLENTLEDFGVNAKVIGVVIGPSVTRYELEMPQGVSVKKILALENDISLALAAKSGIRIEAPIPGKSAVGIEVPNDNISTVSLREVLETDLFKKDKSPVTFALGKNIAGMPELCNLSKMPHILVAGATNSGKSICLNAIIISMIYKTSPENLKLLLIDPKRVEFSAYNDLPHLLIPNVITDVDKAVNALLWCVNEMERRFELLSTSHCRNSDEYNKMPEVLSGEAPNMPYIVVIVDELADLMSNGKKELEEHLRRLTQKARAAGILLVLATQRPSVDVITGVIKANCPARISFALGSNTDSRTILDCGGAETLLGRGDMLYKPSDAPVPRRVQGCFVSSEEVERVVEFIKSNNTGNYDDKAKEEIEREHQTVTGLYEGNVGDKNWDPLLPQALKMFIENGQASTSAIQRRFLAGFPRASRIVDQLCQMGYLSQPDGTKPREVLITMEQFYEKFGRDFE